MDFLIICPFLLALLLSQGSFTDREKQRVDSGLEICILCSLSLMTHVCTNGYGGWRELMHRERVRHHGKGHKEVEKRGSRSTGKLLLCPSVDGL